MSDYEKVLCEWKNTCIQLDYCIIMDTLNSTTNGIHLPNNRYRSDTQVPKYTLTLKNTKKTSTEIQQQNLNNNNLNSTQSI